MGIIDAMDGETEVSVERSIGGFMKVKQAKASRAWQDTLPPLADILDAWEKRHRSKYPDATDQEIREIGETWYRRCTDQLQYEVARKREYAPQDVSVRVRQYLKGLADRPNPPEALDVDQALTDLARHHFLSPYEQELARSYLAQLAPQWETIKQERQGEWQAALAEVVEELIHQGRVDRDAWFSMSVVINQSLGVLREDYEATTQAHRLAADAEQAVQRVLKRSGIPARPAETYLMVGLHLLRAMASKAAETD